MISYRLARSGKRVFLVRTPPIKEKSRKCSILVTILFYYDAIPRWVDIEFNTYDHIIKLLDIECSIINVGDSLRFSISGGLKRIGEERVKAAFPSHMTMSQIVDLIIDIFNIAYGY